MISIELPEKLYGVHIHFVGIKGTGMAALVEILSRQGAVITGSDVSEHFYTDEVLAKAGVKVLPFSEKNITSEIQYVIYSSAYSPQKNPDLMEAQRQKIPMLLYSQALGCLSETAYSCAVCGVHGKTTTTGLAGSIISGLALPAQILAGSQITSFGGNCTLTNEAFLQNLQKNRKIMAEKSCMTDDTDEKQIFIAETCEYQRHFMSFSPKKIILTSVESDHQDYYPTYNDILNAFVDFICRLPEKGQLIYCADDSGACEAAILAKQKRPDICLIPYGEKASAQEGYRLHVGNVESACQNFSIEGPDSFKGSFKLYVPGLHLVKNACAAVALNCELLKTHGLNPAEYAEKMAEGAAKFKGGRRRSEVTGITENVHGDSVVFIDDYGHHPTAIRTTLAGYREFYKGRKIIVDFMSHTYSRTASLFDEFAFSFDEADEIIFHKIYSSARENADDFSVTGEKLYERAKEKYHEKIHYFNEIMDSADFLEQELNQKAGEKYPKGYLFVTMGAGDNWKIGRSLFDLLQKKKHSDCH